jgi:hypothetical protein
VFQSFAAIRGNSRLVSVFICVHLWFQMNRSGLVPEIQFMKTKHARHLPSKILLAAALLMSGDCAQAVDLPAAQPSITEDLPRVDLQHYWFSRRRSWLTICPDDASTLRLYLTPYGLASEMPSSPLYRSDPDAYWRGPIWAPAMYLVIDGLNRGGRRDLAVDLAQRFDRLIHQAGGYYENFDAKTGKGLKTRAYTWTSSVHLLLLHEYGAEFK